MAYIRLIYPHPGGADDRQTYFATWLAAGRYRPAACRTGQGQTSLPRVKLLSARPGSEHALRRHARGPGTDPQGTGSSGSCAGVGRDPAGSAAAESLRGGSMLAETSLSPPVAGRAPGGAFAVGRPALGVPAM